MHFDPMFSANGVWVGGSIIALALTFQHIFLPTMVDGFRDRLFSLRRDLLLLVSRGTMSAKDPAYLHLRDDLNRYIRFAERMTFMRGVLIPTAAHLLADHVVKRQVLSYHQQIIANVSDVGLREALRSIDEKIASAIAIHVFASSPVAWCLAVILLPVAFISAIVAGKIGTFRNRVVSGVSDRAKCEVELLAAA